MNSHWHCHQRSIQPNKAATQLIPVNEKSTSENIQSVAKSGDSDLLGSELKDVAVEKTPEPLENGEFIRSCIHSKVLTADSGDVLVS
jgi:hypothetical protein